MIVEIVKSGFPSKKDKLNMLEQTLIGGRMQFTVGGNAESFSDHEINHQMHVMCDYVEQCKLILGYIPPLVLEILPALFPQHRHFLEILVDTIDDWDTFQHSLRVKDDARNKKRKNEDESDEKKYYFLTIYCDGANPDWVHTIIYRLRGVDYLSGLVIKNVELKPETESELRNLQEVADTVTHAEIIRE